MTYNTVAFDTNSNWASNRYTPTVAGKYLITGNVYCVSDTGQCIAAIYKNGTAIADGNDVAAGIISTVSAGVDMNGTSDYVELWGYDQTSTTMGTSAALHFFNGALLAPLASGSVAGTGTANYIPMWSSSTNLTNSALYQSGGNVGIGTASPAQLLEIAASSAPSEWIHYTGAAAAGNKGILMFTHNRNSDGAQEELGYIQGVAENNQSNGGLRFVARTGADVEVMRMTSGGYVGIGTISPSYQVDIRNSSNRTELHLSDTGNDEGPSWRRSCDPFLYATRTARSARWNRGPVLRRGARLTSLGVRTILSRATTAACGSSP